VVVEQMRRKGMLKRRMAEQLAEYEKRQAESKRGTLLEQR